MSDDNFLARWSRLKKADRAGEKPATAAAPPLPVTSTPASAGGIVEAPTRDPVPLPPVASLTPYSDFTPFMKAEVDPALKRQALKTLFQDPRFNVMDGLDVYIDDYSKPDPLPEGWLEQLNQMARLGEYRDPEEKEPKPEGGKAAASLPEPAPAKLGSANEGLEGEARSPQGADIAVPEAGREHAVPPPGTGEEVAPIGCKMPRNEA